VKIEIENLCLFSNKLSISVSAVEIEKTSVPKNKALSFLTQEFILPNLFEIIDFTDPFVWSYHILGLALAPAICGALFGKSKDNDMQKTWAYRGAGFEISFVLLPFFIYFLINIFSGKINSLLISPELPMAGLLLSSISLLWIMKGARATRDLFPIESLQIMQLVAIVFFVVNSLVVFYLTTSSGVADWFSIINSILIVLCVYGSFGIVAVMNYASQYPEKLARKS